MNQEILFQITNDHLETGLRGFPVGYCTTSKVDPEKGLFYIDHPVAELSSWEPERVIYLFFYGSEPTDAQLDSFKQELIKRAPIKQQVIDHIRNLPREGHPMALYSAAILILGIFEQTGSYEEDCLNLIAKLPELTAVLINAHAGWQGQKKRSAPELGYMENFTRLLRLPAAANELGAVLRLFNILHYDHGGGNLSTFVGKTVASGLEDLYGSIAAAMNALAGPRHGRANQECLQFVQEMADELGSSATGDQVERSIRKKLEKGELIYGFGHAVLRVEDPRATLFYELAKKSFAIDPLVKMALLIREAGSKVLKENPKVSDPYPNVDAISGVVLTAAGFPYPDYYTVLFGLARSVGIAIQIVYERVYARGGKGTPIVRPKYLFKSRTK